MARQVVWNKRAVESFDAIIRFLEEQNNPKEIIEFIKKTDDLIEKINRYPEIGRRTKSKTTIRQYRIDKYRKLYYRKYGRKLIIVLVFDERRNPRNNPFY